MNDYFQNVEFPAQPMGSEVLEGPVEPTMHSQRGWRDLDDCLPGNQAMRWRRGKLPIHPSWSGQGQAAVRDPGRAPGK